MNIHYIVFWGYVCFSLCMLYSIISWLKKKKNACWICWHEDNRWAQVLREWQALGTSHQFLFYKWQYWRREQFRDWAKVAKLLSSRQIFEPREQDCWDCADPWNYLCLYFWDHKGNEEKGNSRQRVWSYIRKGRQVGVQLDALVDVSFSEQLYRPWPIFPRMTRYLIRKDEAFWYTMFIPRQEDVQYTHSFESFWVQGQILIISEKTICVNCLSISQCQRNAACICVACVYRPHLLFWGIHI